MLTANQIEHYKEQGYVVPDYRLPAETIAKIRQHHTDFLSHFPQFIDYCPALFVYDPSFAKYAQNDAILDMVEQLIGPNIAIWNSSFFAKPAKTGSRTPWHQDGEYWPIRPLATCSVWIAIDDSNTTNGCLEFIPKSHRSRKLSTHHTNSAEGLALPLELDADSFDPATSVSIELEAGQMSLHDIFLMHASEPNRSTYPRRGMTMRFMPTTSIYRRATNPGPLADLDAKRPIYLMRGEDVSKQNDLTELAI